MNVDIAVRKLWFAWFVMRFLLHKEGGGSGVTAATLSKHEATILADDYMWQDVILRHDLSNKWPWDAQSGDKANYDHAMGNFWGMVMPYLRPKG